MTKEYKELLEGMELIQNNLILITSALKSKEFKGNNIIEAANRLLDDTDQDLAYAIRDLNHIQEKYAESETSEEAFVSKNIKYLISKIDDHENAVFSILNKPNRPFTHKFNHDALVEYLKKILTQMKQREVNDIDVVMFIESLIADDISRFRNGKQKVIN